MLVLYATKKIIVHTIVTPERPKPKHFTDDTPSGRIVQHDLVNNLYITLHNDIFSIQDFPHDMLVYFHNFLHFPKCQLSNQPQNR